MLRRPFVFGSLPFCLLPALAACGGAPEAASTGDGEAQQRAELTVLAAVKVSKSNSKKIYAHFMPWFETKASSGNGRWGIHWTMANQNPDVVDGSGRRQIASRYYPLIGPYASGDKNVIEYQLLLMKYAGIDSVIIDWPGTLNALDYPKNRANAEALIALTAKVGLEYAIDYEDHNLELAGVSDRLGAARADMAYARDRYFSQANYTQVNGAPLLLVFGPQTLQTSSDWSNVFSVLPQPPTFLTLWYEAGEAGASARGEYSWVYEGNQHLDYFYARGISGVKMGSVYPGYESFYAQGGWSGPGWTIPANGTSTFATTLDKALNAPSTPHVQLVTWNDYGEGTAIEPTRELGYGCLTLLQQRLGVRYGQAELELVARLYAQRVQYAGNTTKQGDLDQAFYYLTSLQPEQARSILDGGSPPSNPSNPTTPTTPMTPTGASYYLKNRWTGAYVSADGGRAKYGSYSATPTYEWVLEDQNGFQRIKSVGGNCYLNIEGQAPYVECSNVPASFYSGYWSLEPLAGYVRLKNAWKGTYLNVEHQTGYAECAAVPESFESGQWSLVKK